MNIQSAIIEGTNILKAKYIQTAQLDTEILMADQTGNVSSITMSELLPFAFELDK